MSLLKNQIISFKNAEKLKELGFHQESLFYYVNNYRTPSGNEVDNGQHIIAGERKHLFNRYWRKKGGTEVEFVSAYTLAEILVFSIYTFEVSNLTANNVATTLIDVLGKTNGKAIKGYNKAYRKYFDLDDEECECIIVQAQKSDIKAKVEWVKIVECDKCKNKDL